MAGTVGVRVGGIDGLSVTFGDPDVATTNPSYYGLVITDGSLTSLDMTVNSTFDVASVAFNATNLQFVYVAASDSFSMSGTVGASVAGIDDLSVTFGSNGQPGLVITDGSLTSLDMIISSTFDVADVAFKATNLQFVYVTATDTFSMAGTVGVSIGGIAGLSVTFGDAQANPITDPADYYGLIIQNGGLVSMNMFISANFSVADVEIDVTNLEFDYVTATSTFSMAGTVGVTIQGIGDELSATFGDAQANPQTDPADYYGLIVQNGQLRSLNLFINAKFYVDAVEFYATNLDFDYVTATNAFSMAGTVGVTVAGIDNLSVTFGDPNASQVNDPALYYGLIIDNGTLTHLDATINASFQVDELTIFAKNLDFDYTNSNGTTHVHADRQCRSLPARGYRPGRGDLRLQRQPRAGDHQRQPDQPQHDDLGRLRHRRPDPRPGQPPVHIHGIDRRIHDVRLDDHRPRHGRRG